MKEKIKQQKIKDKTNKTKIKKNTDSYALYNFPYYNDSLNYSWLYPIKAFLACITAACGISYLALLLDFSQGVFSFAAAAFFACGAYFILLGYFKSLPVAAITLGVLTLYCFTAVRHSGLYANAKDFLSHYMLVADRGLVQTSNSYFTDSDGGAVSFMILLSFVYGIVFAFCTAKRFHPDVIVLFSAVLAVPAFVARSACFYPPLVVFVAGLLAIWAMNQSMGANIILSTGGAINMRGADREYRKSIKRLSPRARMATEGKHYTKHLSDGIIIFIIVAFTMSSVSSSFPHNGSIKFDKMVKKVVEWGQGVGQHFSNVFADLDIKLGGKSYLNGYFSADGNSINISNSINPNTAGREGIPVLEVVTENKDKLYLRGDIGYDFDGDNWKSISELDYLNIKCAPSQSIWSDLSFDSQEKIPVQSVLDNYVPELQMLLARNIQSFIYGDDNSVNPIGIETVKIDYLKNINTVLFPGTPFVYNFRENDNFNVYGDFVAVSDGKKINSMETGVLYLNRPIGYIDEYYDEYMFEQLDTDLTFEEFQNYASTYKNFVNEYYTKIDSEYSGIINNFAGKCKAELPTDFYSNYEFKFMYCNAVMDYLNSGRYKYSLSNDNFSNKMSPPLYNFLYNTKEGHCAMYATAMCLALRHEGIPARYVTGFTVGGDKCEKIGNNQYKYIVTDKDLHAWVEVYYDNLGWVPYDPTPGTIRDADITPPVVQTSATTPTAEETTIVTTAPVTTSVQTNITTTSAQSSVTASSAATAATEDTPSAPDLDSESVKIILIISGIVLVLFVLLMTVLGFFKKLNRKQRELLKYFQKGDPTGAVKAMLPFMLKLLAIRGVIRIKGETPEEFGIRADEHLNMTSAVEMTIPVFEKSEFDKNPVFTFEEQQAAYECIIKLLNDTLGDMKAPKRLLTRAKLFGKRQKALNRK